MIKTITDKIIAVEIPKGAKNIRVEGVNDSKCWVVWDESGFINRKWLPEGKWEIMGMRDELMGTEKEEIMDGYTNDKGLTTWSSFTEDNSLHENTIFLQQVNE